MSSRTSDLLDEPSSENNCLDSHYIDLPSSVHSSDSGDLEVAETENLPTSYGQSFQTELDYQSPSTNSKYYADFSVNHPGSNLIYEGTSNFYNSFESYKNEEEPSYSLNDSPENSGLHHPEPKYKSVPTPEKKSKKKKNKDKNESYDPEINIKIKKRKGERDFNSEPPKKRSNKYVNHEKGDNYFSSMHTSTLSEDSSDDMKNTKINKDYNPSIPFDEQGILLPEQNLEGASYKKISKNKKKKHKHNVHEGSSLKKRLESSNIGNLLMQKMGYVEGEGLGKHAQGRTDPVELSNQKGRRGLGLSLPGLDGETIEWDQNLEDICEKEAIYWLENYELETLDYETMLECWIKEGVKNLNIGSMTDFIEEEILTSILRKKDIFDNLSEDELRRAVLRSNPFESIRKGIFLNRAALKMANIDSAFEFMFTDPKHRDGTPMVRENELLYFADVCAGPGGFSEYILYRKSWQAKGIGFTLKGDNDFKLQDFLAGPSETFEPYYGINNDGNIFDPANITSLTDFVMKVTNKKGVHFMMADGGFSVKGQENIQELLSKQLYLCQCLVALSIVQDEGHFVCKLFDLFSSFSAGLIYLMYRAFHKICLFKPNTSRPANSERYIICKHKRTDSDQIRDYLFKINERLWELGQNSEVDIIECVPLNIIEDNSEFFNYLRDSNNRLGNKQIVNLDKIAAYYQDQTLHEPLQNELKNRCMNLWKVPSGPRKTSHMSDYEAAKKIFQSIFKNSFKPQIIPEVLNTKGKSLNSKNLKDFFAYSILDWRCVPLGSDKTCFLLGLGRNRVYRWNNSKWEHESHLELTPGTLIYGEFMPEYRGDRLKQTKVTAFHIIDGISIDFKPIAHYPYEERLMKLDLLTKSLHKWNPCNVYPFRVKKPTALNNIYDLFQRVGECLLKSTNHIETCLFHPDPDCEYIMQLKGIMFLRTTREPWRQHISKKHRCPYYYNSENRQSFYEKERPSESVASSIDSLNNQVLWMLEAGVGFKGEMRHNEVLHKDDLVDFIHKRSLM